MRCQGCGSENPADARFCASCGEAIERSCPSCGVTFLPGQSFCTSCGARLAAEAARGEGEERKIVTVLFADLVGFTGRAERLDPEDVRAVLAPFHARVHRVLERFGGTVEKYIGDAVMALFGAPVSHEDDAERAVRAAVEVRNAIAGLTAREPELELRVRIGVNTGEAVVSLDARPSTGEGMASGDVVNTAARLQTSAAPNAIVVGESTYRATRDAVDYRECEPFQVKGKSQPLRAWEFVALRSPDEEDADQRDAPLVGRHAELARLNDALDRVRQTHASELITLVGVPGIGKSRLLVELRGASDGATWLQGRSLPYGEGVTFWALSEMVKTRAHVLSSDPAETAEQKLRAAVDAVVSDDSEARWIEGHLRPLVGLAGDVEPRGDRRGEAFAAWRRFFAAIADDEPLVLAFEDLHWADDGLLDFVDQLVGWIDDVPLLVVATTRPELLGRRPGWGGGMRRVTTIPLAPLTEEETGRLIDALLQHARVPESARSALLTRTGGNPLYAGEYVRMLSDQGVLRRRGDSWWIAHGQALPLPESVQAIIAARVDALTAEEKSLVQAAAVVGEHFWSGALGAVGSMPRDDVERLLQALERKEFVRRQRSSSVEGELQFSFRHVLVRDVAYAQIPRARRADKHRLAAEWLESLAASRSEDQAEMLAHHYGSALRLAKAAGRDVGNLAERARTVLREAGDRASALNAAGAAARYYAGALELMSADDPLRPDVLFRRGQALLHAEEGGAAELDEARKAFLSRDDAAMAAEADVLLAALLSNRNERSRAREHLDRAAELVADAPSSRSKASVLASSARFMMLAGEDAEAIRIGEAAHAMAAELRLEQLRAHTLNTIGMARFATGGDGAGDLERSIEIATAVNSPEGVRSLKFLGATHALLGDLDRSAELFARTRLAAERFHDAYNIRWLQAESALELYWRGRWDEALAIADKFVAEAEVGAPHYMEASCRRARGQIRLARGELDAARTDAIEALESSRAARDPWFLNPSLAFRARTLVDEGKRDEANALADELLGLWRRTARVSRVAFEVGDLAVAMAALGRGGDLLAAAAEVVTPTRWLAAGCAYVAGDFLRAADLFAEIGSRPDEAQARLEAAKWLPLPTAAGERDRALEFFREVGAKARVQELETLLAPAS